MDQSREVLISGDYGQRINNKAMINGSCTRELANKRQFAAHEEDINDRAEAFIKNFRNQLKIQREDSLKRFQEMLARGV